MTVNNLSNNYNKYAYTLVTRWNGELWFWGSFNDRNRANEVAIEEGCEVYPTEIVESGLC